MEIKPPLILNFDDSAGALPKACILGLTAWQERIRFACSWGNFRALEARLRQSLPPCAACGTAFLGSGDYHHVSYLLIKRLGESLRLGAAGEAAGGAYGSAAAEKLDVVILDNHPDNMRYPFGIHCGSWVAHLAALPFIGKIDVVGISSGDIGAAHAVENRLLPLMRGQLTYWSAGVNTKWARFLGLARAFRSFGSAAELTQAFAAAQARRTAPLYLSLDKDVLARSAAQTNWDQGLMEKTELFALIKALKPRIIGSDVVGEVSVYRYKSLFKRIMSRLDGQEPVAKEQLKALQSRANALNRALLPLLG